MSEEKETMEYVFCESCQTEVERYAAYKQDHIWYCKDCYKKLFLEVREVRGSKSFSDFISTINSVS